jgi:hypothetical protein
MVEIPKEVKTTGLEKLPESLTEHVRGFHGKPLEVASTGAPPGLDLSTLPPAYRPIYAMNPDQLRSYVDDIGRRLAVHAPAAGYTSSEFAGLIAPFDPTDVANRTISEQLAGNAAIKKAQV